MLLMLCSIDIFVVFLDVFVVFLDVDLLKTGNNVCVLKNTATYEWRRLEWPDCLDVV